MRAYLKINKAHLHGVNYNGVMQLSETPLKQFLKYT